MTFSSMSHFQTFGPNFELLVASRKHVSVDSVSGSLRGSDPVSPMSPGSPDPYSHGAQQQRSNFYQSQRLVERDLKHALSSLQPGHRALSPPVL